MITMPCLGLDLGCSFFVIVDFSALIFNATEGFPGADLRLHDIDRVLVVARRLLMPFLVIVILLLRCFL
jgi:hypothetical protein